uniref:Fibulin-2-like n=1 Tax=Salarias fasciatus TaxID=181472 RepID=A0A672IWH0_SALFA
WGEIFSNGVWDQATFFLFLTILCLDVCLSQNDCTGVDCPVLQNCIETVLEKDACCPVCSQRGCTCEGYQYYDCVRAGFREGKVPQGTAYFVDFGSTECSCPQGGGKISCYFIPCPEIPPNCIDISRPADGCVQCGRIGCVNGNKKYEAGHSFQVDHCQVCHCPDQGGRLMCSPIPGCDPRRFNKPLWATTTENTNPLRNTGSRHDSRQTMLLMQPNSCKHYFVRLLSNTGCAERDKSGCLCFIPVSAKELVKTCCETGEKWASANGHCNNMDLPTKDRHSMCWTAQQQCCLGSLSESQCLAGINAARAGSKCEEEASNKCGIDSYKECCGCCSLGLQFRSGGHRCEAHRYLGFHCRHVFLTCCDGEEGRNLDEDGWHTVRERPALDSTPPPKKVSDNPYPKEAFSIGEEPDAQNGVEGPVEVEDMDECVIYEGNICHHRCVNTPGSFRCECFPGYVLLEDAFTCAQGKVLHASLYFLSAAFSNPILLLCTCHCLFSLLPLTHKRLTSLLFFPHHPDINECSSARACQPNERCTNTAGSYVCQRVITCPPGYQINNDICEDINECVQGGHNCGVGFECVNTEGSFRCNPKPRCSTGFQQDAQGNCIDIDECGALTQPCSSGFNCINTVGSYMCNRKIICSRGYHASPDGSRCVDVDECQSNLHQCGDGQLCQNLPGSYRCECQTGYQYDSFRRMCVDVNECWRYPGRLCAQTCENTPGSYECSCTSGFRLSGDGKNCEDVNECLANPCGQECANIYGSYQCYCRQGYYLREDGHTCDDIDECTQSIGHLCTYKCVNVPGSYQCACPEYGYTMSPNGRSCRDIDECTTGAHNCSLAETCYNIQGGYRCLSLSCPPNYRKVSDTRCERISCPNYLDCQNSPLRITYYYLSFQSNIVIPAQIFRIGPSPAYAGDNVIVTITQGNEENYFSTRKLNAYTGAVYLHRQVEGPRDFLITVEMKLWRQGTFTTFQAKIYVFITGSSL